MTADDVNYFSKMNKFDIGPLNAPENSNETAPPMMPPQLDDIVENPYKQNELERLMPLPAAY